MGLPSTAIKQESLYFGDIAGTTDSGKAFPIFFNNSGLDIVITEAAISSVKGLDASHYMTVTMRDQDANAICTLAYTVVSQELTLLTAMGTCSATHGVIPDAEYVYIDFTQTASGDSLDDFSIHWQWRYQTPSE